MLDSAPGQMLGFEREMASYAPAALRVELGKVYDFQATLHTSEARWRSLNASQSTAGWRLPLASGLTCATCCRGSRKPDASSSSSGWRGGATSPRCKRSLRA